MAPYKAGLLYFHGGASLQELVVPVLTAKLEPTGVPNLERATVRLTYKTGATRVTTRLPVVDVLLEGDIFSQAAQAVRTPMGVDPMGGLPVERIIAAGASQSAARLVVYHNSIHPLAGVLDGYMVVVGGKSLRTDLDVKVFKVESETTLRACRVRTRL